MVGQAVVSLSSGERVQVFRGAFPASQSRRVEIRGRGGELAAIILSFELEALGAFKEISEVIGEGEAVPAFLRGELDRGILSDSNFNLLFSRLREKRA